MNVKCYTTKDMKWNEQIKKLPIEKQDIYYMREYALLCEHDGHSEAVLFSVEKGENIGIYVFIKTKIEQWHGEDDYYDIETPYGYGGPVVSMDDQLFEEIFEKLFIQYCRENNIIAEFVRFHPLFKNHTVFKKNIEVLANRTTVSLDLTLSEEEIWMKQIGKQNRNTIRKAAKNGLVVEETRDDTEFRKLYENTMHKVGAEQFYYFDDSYYRRLWNNQEIVLLQVKKIEEQGGQDDVLAAAFFMGCGEYFHYHLAGSKKEYLKLAPNNLLLWEAIRYGKRHGYKKMHFGGGLTNEETDSLFQFKKKFSRDTNIFYIGKRVHNYEVYSALVNEWERKTGRKSPVLLCYREG